MQLSGSKDKQRGDYFTMIFFPHHFTETMQVFYLIEF